MEKVSEESYEWTEEELLQLATTIGGAVEQGLLPPKHEDGQYRL